MPAVATVAVVAVVVVVVAAPASSMVIIVISPNAREFAIIIVTLSSNDTRAYDHERAVRVTPDALNHQSAVSVANPSYEDTISAAVESILEKDVLVTLAELTPLAPFTDDAEKDYVAGRVHSTLETAVAKSATAVPTLILRAQRCRNDNRNKRER